MFDLLGAWLLVSLAERPAEVPEDQQAVWEDNGRHTPSPAEAGECSALRPPRQGTYLNVSYLVSVADPDPTYKQNPHFSCSAYFFVCFMTTKFENDTRSVHIKKIW